MGLQSCILIPTAPYICQWKFQNHKRLGTRIRQLRFIFIIFWNERSGVAISRRRFQEAQEISSPIVGSAGSSTSVIWFNSLVLVYYCTCRSNNQSTTICNQPVFTTGEISKLLLPLALLFRPGRNKKLLVQVLPTKNISKKKTRIRLGKMNRKQHMLVYTALSTNGGSTNCIHATHLRMRLCNGNA